MAAMALTLATCHRESGDAVLLIVVTASGSLGTVTALDVTLSGPAGTSSPEHYARDDQQTIAFPTTLTAVVPARATGSLTIDVHATDATGATVATGHEGPHLVAAGGRETVYVQLDCGGSPCVTDGGGTGTDGGAPGGGPSCGNGRVDPTETCDTAIARQNPGACPPADPLHPCNDGVACTRDIPSGSGCTAVCRHEEITVAATGDDCCPAGKTSAEDPDCSPTCGDGIVDQKETCDLGIAAGSPGACPTDADCASGDPCSADLLVSAGTCSAICMHYPVTIRSGTTNDGCCPPGATHGVDVDCPVVCGNGVRESSEQCDPGIPNPLPDSCPNCGKKKGCLPGCDDGDPCTTDFVRDTGCQATCENHLITVAPVGRRLLSGGSHPCDRHRLPADLRERRPRARRGLRQDRRRSQRLSDLLPVVSLRLSRGDARGPGGRLLRALRDDDDHRLLGRRRTAAARRAARPLSDADCSPACGDGFLEPTLGEVCDQAVRAGRPGACPTSCASGNPCTEARLLGAGTCAATCVLLPITEPRAGDGCCPAGADFSVDTDCTPSCGNGVVESPAETCDYNAGAGASCPTGCPPAGACMRVELHGSPLICSATCTAEPIVACVAGDNCCPAGCTAVNDPNCAVICGDGAVEPGERCDRAITAGTPGACLRSCDDGNDCTVDVAYGSVESCTRSCSHQPITACLGGDGCCPPGCTGATDGDCSPVCGDGKVGAGETCDPPTTCPTACPDDGDPCTSERLTGDPSRCDAVCRHTPITTCSGSTGDACCPTGCTSATDSDC